jgi:hypothetical protein
VTTTRKADPEKLCETCGEPMERKRYNGRLEDRTRFLERKHCSQSCANTRTEIQPNSHRWRARQIRKRDACEECRTKLDLHVHHKDRNPANNDPSNLAVLCASCHLKLHWREDRAKRLASLILPGGRMRQPSADGKPSSAGQLPGQLSPGERASA